MGDEAAYAFLATTYEGDPAAHLIGAIHPKAMPVILHDDDHKRWLTAPVESALNSATLSAAVTLARLQSRVQILKPALAVGKADVGALVAAKKVQMSLWQLLGSAASSLDGKDGALSSRLESR